MDPLLYLKGEYKRLSSLTASGAAKLPNGYELPQAYDYKFFSPHTTNYGNEPPGTLIYTTLPAVTKEPTARNYPDGWTHCLISPSAKRAVLNTPGFPQRIARPPEVRHRIAPAPGRGVGVFATVDLKAGDLIFSERPMIIAIPTVPAPHPSQVPSYFTQNQIMQVGLQQVEKQFKVLFARLLEDQQEAYMALHNSHKHDGSGPILGILRTNSFGVLVGSEIYGSVCKDASRLNHSCRPNTSRVFNSRTFALEIRAARDIKKGGELTTPYVDPDLFHRERQRGLDPYGFQCRCEACKDPKASDAKRAFFKQNTPDHVGRMRLAVWLMQHDLSEDYVAEHSKQQLAMMEDEALEASVAYMQHLWHFVDLYSAAENLAEAVVYLKKLDAARLSVTGGETKSIAEHMKKAKAHRTWGWKRRMSDVLKFIGN